MASQLQYTVSGTGMCIILANFVGDQGECLTGYKEDVRKIEEFFSILNFKVVTKKNQSSRQFREFLENYVTAFDGVKFDRLFIFVLSHGDKNGVCMCEESLDKSKESSVKIITKEMDSQGRPVTVAADEIISYFTHDKLGRLKGVPKCFFFQACRGQSYSQMAGAVNEEIIRQSLRHSDDVPKLMASHRFPIRADIFVAYATLEGSTAFVKHKYGSSFISTLIESMKNYGRKNDICQIMTTVINEASTEGHKKFFHCNSLNYDVRVLDSGKLCPVRICGQVKPEESDESESSDSDCDEPEKSGDESESDSNESKSDSSDSKTGSDTSEGGDKTEGDPEIDHPRPLYVSEKGGKWSYTGFIMQEPVIMDEAKHRLEGTIRFKKGGQIRELMTFRDLTYEKLSSFKDNSYFTVEGTLCVKDSSRGVATGDICVEQNRLKVEEKICPLNENIPASNLELSVLIEGKYVDISEFEGRQGCLFINDIYYGMGTIQRETEGEVFGIYTEMFQVPTFTSTLTKTLYITQPTDDKVLQMQIAKSASELCKLASGYIGDDTPDPSNTFMVNDTLQSLNPE